MGPLPPSTMASPPTSQAGVRTSSGGMSIGSLVHPSTEYRYNNLGTPTYSGFSRPMPFSNGFISSDDSYYTPDGSQSPASEAYSRYAHRQSISSSSSVAAFEAAQGSPHVNGATTWIPSSAPPNVLPANMFEDPSYFNVCNLHSLFALLLRLISPPQTLHYQYPSPILMAMNSTSYDESYHMPMVSYPPLTESVYQML